MTRRSINLTFIARVAMLLLATALAGCVEREEKIVVHKDGSCTITLTLTGDNAADLARETAVAADGWAIQTSQVKDGKGKIRQMLTATMDVPRGAALPANYLPGADPDRALSLQFPTTLQVQKRSDGVYYEFHRAYEPRAWAWCNLIEDRDATDQLVHRLQDQQNKLTPAEWQAAVRQQVGMEMRRKLAVARQAVLDAAPGLPQEVWLKAHQGVVDKVTQIDADKLVLKLQEPESDARNDSIAQEAQKIDDSTDDAIRQGLIDGGMSAKQVEAFDKAYATLNRRNMITSQIANEKFAVKIRMPGEVIGSNGEKQPDGTVEWRFTGKQTLDRQVELMAASKAAGN